MNKITKQNGTLLVPDKVVIPFIEGDGVGAEITPVCQRIVDEAVGRAYGGQRVIEWKEVLAGEKAFKQTGSWLPDETMEAFREYMIGIKGPLTTPIGGGIRSLNVALRQTLDLYVCLRPVRWFRGVVTPVKEPEKVDMYIFRENTEDIYAGIEWQQGTSEARKFLKFLTEEMGVTKVRFPETSSFGVKPVSVEGTERLVRAAIEFALANRLPSVTLVHKGNIMKFTEGGFKLWGYALAEREFPDKTFTWPQYEKIKKEKGEDAAATALLDAEAAGKVVIKDVIADAFLQNTLLVPEEYSVIATLNLNGDYVSDQLAAMVGGIGICGRELCCHEHLSEFVPVSIKMAKEQNLSLNPTKISGVCGRLMCCLKHEQDTYEYLNEKLPNVGDFVRTVDGNKGEVLSVSVLRQKVRIVVTDKDDNKEVMEYPVSELKFKPKKRRNTERISDEEYKALEALEDKGGKSKFDD